MFVTHPDTVCAVSEIGRRALLAEAAEARHVAQARPVSIGLSDRVVSMRHRFGSAVIALGRRLQGAEPGALVDTATAGSGVVS